MTPSRRVLVLLAAMLTASLAGAPAMAQHDETARLNNRIVELSRAGKFSEATLLAYQALTNVQKTRGADHPDVAAALNNLADLLRVQGRVAEAEPLCRRGLAIREKAFGPGHAAVAVSLNSLALVYRAQGRYREAEPLFRRALAIEEKVVGANHPTVAAALNNLAVVLEAQGRLAEAEGLHKRALAIREKALGPSNPDVALSLGNLATLYANKGSFAQAEPLHRRALTIWETALGPAHPNVATSLNNLAALYDSEGRYGEAEPLYRRALAIREKALGKEHPDVAGLLNNLAMLHYNQGRYGEAEPLFKGALAIYEKALGPEHRDIAVALNNLAVLYKEQGRKADAEPLYKRALAIREKVLGSDHAEVAQSLNNLALLYDLQDRRADAEPLYRRALAIREKALGPGHPDVAQSLNNLAFVDKDQGRYDEAEALHKRALAIREKALGPAHPDVAQSLDNLANLYREVGRYADAEPLLRRALTIREQALGTAHPDVALSLNNLALLFDIQGRYGEAEPLYTRALQVHEKALGPDHQNTALSRSNLADLYRAQGREGEALALVEVTIRQDRANPPVALRVLRAASDKGLLPAGQAQDEALRVVQRAAQSAAAAAVGKLGVRLAAGSDRLAGLVRRDQDFAAEADSLDKAIIAAVSREQAKRDVAAEQRIRDRLAQNANERAALQGVLGAEFPDYAALSNPLPLAVADIQTLLAPDEALILYATGERESHVFAMTRTKAAWAPVPQGTAALASRVAAFRRGLDVGALRQSAADGKPVLFDLGLASDLYADLIGPVEEVTSGAGHLLVVPSGPLTALPFHLLVTNRPPVAVPEFKDVGAYRGAAWLIKQQAVSVLPALASLKALRSGAGRDPGVKPLVGFADPVFDPAERALAQRGAAQARAAVRGGYRDFWQGAGIDRVRLRAALPSLPDTADELKAVAGNLGAAAGDVHLGSEASEATVKRTTLADYRVVYFATHGLVAGDVAGLGEPSLALTLPGQPSELDDGLLTASEVAQLKLNADFVVLSACNTAAADKPGAEALSGLARAFFYAGARALLVSHWSVDSAAATRLTTATFAVLAARPKLGRAAALREAMLAYMNDEASPLNAYPAFWGPFEVIGEGAAR